MIRAGSDSQTAAISSPGTYVRPSGAKPKCFATPLSV